MIINASVLVKDGDVGKALRALERKLKKQRLWGYDPEKRRYPERTKRKRGRERKKRGREKSTKL